MGKDTEVKLQSPSTGSQGLTKAIQRDIVARIDIEAMDMAYPDGEYWWRKDRHDKDWR